jgi:hypothetical protein
MWNLRHRNSGGSFEEMEEGEMTNNVEPTEEEKENAKTISLDGMGVLPSNEDELTRYGKRELKNLTSVISQALAEQRGKFEKVLDAYVKRGERIRDLEKAGEFQSDSLRKIGNHIYDDQYVDANFICKVSQEGISAWDKAKGEK